MGMDYQSLSMTPSHLWVCLSVSDYVGAIQLCIAYMDRYLRPVVSVVSDLPFSHHTCEMRDARTEMRPRDGVRSLSVRYYILVQNHSCTTEI